MDDDICERSDIAVNVYGSMIAEELSEDEDVEITGEEESIGRVSCCCKGQCARKKGKGRCPCKEADLKCLISCTCDKSKCKNKELSSEGILNVDEAAVADGAENFVASVEQSDNDILEFVGNLNQETQTKLLVKLLSMGRGSLDFAKQLVGEDVPEQPSSPPGYMPWCVCRVCRPMETEQENVCCRKRLCVTSYRTFHNICLDRDILEVCIKARCDIRADDFNFSMESFRKAAYRQYALWRYGKLGRGNRRVLPACVVRFIRQAYPAPDGHYMGYRNS